MKLSLRFAAFALFVSLSFSARAQWVSIPDTNFGKWLNTNGYTACLQGNSQVGWQLDTTCPAVLNASKVNCNNQGIKNLSGIEYFDNLDTLFCYSNLSSVVPALPNSLQILDCSWCTLTSLPPLPSGLVSLECDHNLLTALPALPSTLQILDCDNNQLTSLPALPAPLLRLECFTNQLSSLPALPNMLTYIGCNGNQIQTMPVLPDSLQNLVCFTNLLTGLPALPDALRYLTCGDNSISSLPALPPNLLQLHCGGNSIAVIPSLPATLQQLVCGANLMTSLPALPNSLLTLSCTYGPLASLPALPSSLRDLYITWTQVQNVPALPASLRTMTCDNTPISSLPALPAGLVAIQCDSTQLTSLPELPDSLVVLYCQGNPNLRCLPRLKTVVYFKFDSTVITCLPNYPESNSYSSPPLSSVPLCDVFNSNNCPVYWNISGMVYHDTSSNCTPDAGEVRCKNFPVKLSSGGVLQQEFFTSAEGFYSFDTDLGSFNYTIDTAGLPVFVTCPNSSQYTSTLTALDSLDFDMDFGVECKPGFDLGVWSVVANRALRPANNAYLHIRSGDYAQHFGVSCAGSVSGQVVVTLSGPVSYQSNSGLISPSNVTSNVITYNISDFDSVDIDHAFAMIIRPDTNAQIGQQVCVAVAVTPTSGDNNTANNSLTHCFDIVNSYDPNDKQAHPNGDIDTAQEWLTYTIRFQNTGTDTAIHIYITDTLDSDVEPSSFQLLAYSHQPMVQIKQNAVRFNFPNINLPDSNTNELLSHGYVQYKVKLKDNLPIGTVINNTAFIYFDFNAPVVTNTTTNTVALVSGIQDTGHKTQDFRIHPNPASDVVIIAVDEVSPSAEVIITDLTGRKMLAEQLQSANYKVQTGSLSNGVYFVTVTTKEGRSTTKKLVIQR